MNAATAPVTYRQLDYWIRLGLIHTIGDPTPGTGHPRDLADGEDRVLELMAPLVADGVTPRRAAAAARELLEHGVTTIGGHTITTRPPGQE